MKKGEAIYRQRQARKLKVKKKKKTHLRGNRINPYSRYFHQEVKHTDPNKPQQKSIRCEYLLEDSNNKTMPIKGSKEPVAQSGR